ncbi:MAG: TlpA family protein disulfide reductase [Candidatus Aminicenantes bacterium]|nr:TlpA family protein disulfide reductase [Candidatus Aminicenantes bacterium]
MILPNSAPLYGMTNIFFEDPGSSAIRRLETWKDVKLARIVGNPALKPVDALQYRDETGTVQIVVDTDSDGDWQDEKRLVFERSGDSLFADFKIRFVPPDGNAPSADPVSYQIIRTGPYVYARIREYRTGRLQIGDDSYAVLLRPESRENPLYGSGRTLLFIDLDRNGEIAQFWEERKTGELMPSEQVSVAQPFLLAGRKFEVESLDPEGTQLILKPTTVDIGVSPGFLAPSLEAQDLEGRIHSLQDLRGKVVLLEFWSVDCPWADTVRPLINAVAEKFKGPEFAVLSVAREKDPTVLRDYLKAKPKSTIVLRRDDNAWKIFNPDGMTPLCFVLDRGGVIRLIAPGARSQKALEAAIAGLITAR